MHHSACELRRITPPRTPPNKVLPAGLLSLRLRKQGGIEHKYVPYGQAPSECAGRFRGTQAVPRHLTVARTSPTGASLSSITSAPAFLAFSMPAGSRLALKTNTLNLGL